MMASSSFVLLCRLGKETAAFSVCWRQCSPSLQFAPQTLPQRRLVWTQHHHHQQQKQQLKPKEQPEQQDNKAHQPRSSLRPITPLSSPHKLQLQKPLETPLPDIITHDIEGFPLCSLAGDISHARPLVVLIGWLNAKRKHLLKFQELYWRRGFDVLTMDVAPIHVVRPVQGIKYTSKLFKVLQEHEMLNNRKVVFHGFSIGAFIYTQLQKMLEEQKASSEPQDSNFSLERENSKFSMETGKGDGVLNKAQDVETPEGKFRDLSDRIVGLVLDSPAYIDHMCAGIANSVTTVPALRSLINNSLLMYLAAFPKSVTYHYQESHRMFHDNRVPTLLLYSPIDQISSATVSERYAQEWQEKGLSKVFVHKFPGTSHVSHYRHYPEEYAQALGAFVDQLDLSASVGSKVKVCDRSSATSTAGSSTAAAAEVQ